MLKPMTARCPDYQYFDFDADGHVCSVGERLKAKLQAIPLPDLAGKTVLDVGCDFGFWTFLAANKGAKRVLGLDRNRPVRGTYFDLIGSNRAVAAQYPALTNCTFENVNIGKQWKEFGKFDVVFLFSLYHHIFENVGDHDPIWFWLWRHCAPGALLLWENPVDTSDGVVTSNVSADKLHLYTRDNIMKAASQYFGIEYVGPALHEPTRHVYRFTPKPIPVKTTAATLKDGSGGATTAFTFADGRRAAEVESALGYAPFPGSLNLELPAPFDFGVDYYRAMILDVLDRGQGFTGAWGPRWARFYPVEIDGIKGHALRFEGEDYPLNMVEVIAPVRLRDTLTRTTARLERV